MYIVMLGPPGGGKGTQASLLAEKLNIPHISTGELFRDEMNRGTPLGKEITQIINSGQLVSDETTLKIFAQRLEQPDAQEGTILDGIPRTLEQARMLDELFSQSDKKIDHVLCIDLPEDEIIIRLTGRWTCQKCGHTYHEIYNPPSVPGVCDYDQSPLYKREDQKEEVIKERVRVYLELTEPLIKYYEEKGILIHINGLQSIKEVTLDILKKLSI
jgi:adenylate kinase